MSDLLDHDHDHDHEAPADSALWLSLSEIARLKGVERTTIWEKAERLIADGLLSVRRGKGKRKLVNLAEYDRLVGETTDFARQQAAITRSRDESDTDRSFSTQQRRKMQYEADLRQLELAERFGKLVRLDKIEEATVLVGRTIAGLVDRIPHRADDVVAAVTKDSLAGARRILKTIAFDLRNNIADAYRSLSMKAPRTDPPLDEAALDAAELSDGAPE